MNSLETALTIESLSADEVLRYEIRSYLEILGILRDIIRNGERVALYYADRSKVVVTLLLEADDRHFYLDIIHDEPICNELLADSGVIFVSAHFQAKVQFATGVLQEVQREEERFIAGVVPVSMVRLQRRDFFRLFLPPAQLLCRLGGSAESFADDETSYRVRDISEGGMALYCEEGDDALTPGQIIEGCRLQLDDGSEIMTGIEVRYTSSTHSTHEQGHRFAGCRFVTLSWRLSMQLQRFITRRQRETHE